MTTFEILEALQNEVGSRRAGTEGEERAQNWLKERAEKLGLSVEMDEFTFIGNEKYMCIIIEGIFVRFFTIKIYITYYVF